MSENARILAFTEQVNLSLFGDVTHFILNATDASHEQISRLAYHCVLFDPEREPGSIQENHSSLYLGELMGWCEERCGMPLRDLRAIALDLSFAHGFLTKEMFVGSQKRDFVAKIKK